MRWGGPKNKKTNSNPNFQKIFLTDCQSISVIDVKKLLIIQWNRAEGAIMVEQWELRKDKVNTGKEKVGSGLGMGMDSDSGGSLDGDGDEEGEGEGKGEGEGEGGGEGKGDANLTRSLKIHICLFPY